MRNAVRIEMPETPSIRNGAQADENVRKNCVLNNSAPVLARMAREKP
jgi:hypothetical protein